MTAQLPALMGLLLLVGASCDAPAEARETAPAVRPARAPAGARVFQPVVAGQFYPAQAVEIREMISGFLKAAKPAASPLGQIVALVSPHAGYVYSGSVAAYGYRLLQGKKFKRVVVLAPSHHAFSEKIGALPYDAYRTPLGELTIDREAVDALVNKYPFVGVEETLFAREHSLEVQLPFLQIVLPGVPVVPLVHGNPSAELARKLAVALDESFPGQDTLVIASSDLSHFHPYDEAKSKDLETLGHITRNEQQALAEKHATRECELCGFGPVLTVMELARLRGAEGALLRYANSGDTAGDRSRVVGYGVVVFSKK